MWGASATVRGLPGDDPPTFFRARLGGGFFVDFFDFSIGLGTGE
jgi:hypothetical protein